MIKVSAALLAVAASVSLVGCDPGPKCLSGHSITTYHTVKVGKIYTVQPQTTWHCDEYEKGSK